MNTPSNIQAVQSTGAAGPPKGKAGSGSPSGLLGFFDAILQQINATLQTNGQLTAAQTSASGTPDVKGLSEKIAALLKKDGITAADIAKMSPQDLAAKIAQLMQQQNVSIPAALQNISTQDLSTQLATLLQSKATEPAIANGAGSFVKPTLTSDLTTQQSAHLQSADAKNTQDAQNAPPTKTDVAQKISDFLEKLQRDTQNTTAVALSPAQLQQLRGEIAQLQAAPGKIDPATLNRLSDDLGQFLSRQGVDKTTVSDFIADLMHTLDKTKTADTAAGTTTLATAAQTQTPAAPQAVLPQQTPATTTKAASAPQTTLPHASTASDKSSAKNPQQPTGPQDASTGAANKSAPYKGIGKAQDTGKTAANNINNGKSAVHTVNAATAQTQQAAPQPQNITAKLAGLHSATAAAVNALSSVDANSASTGGNSGFNMQDGNAQPQGLTTLASLLQPSGTPNLGQSFTNYLSAATHGNTPSPTTQMVAVQMIRNMNAGINAMSFQLEPADLGRLDVKLKFAKNGSVKAHMTVDKPETLALLQKDSSHLQNILRQSGLHADENALSFDLRQQNQQQNSNGYNGGGGRANAISANTNNGVPSGALQAHIAIRTAGYITQSGVNIMV